MSYPGGGMKGGGDDLYRLPPVSPHTSPPGMGGAGGAVQPSPIYMSGSRGGGGGAPPPYHEQPMVVQGYVADLPPGGGYHQQGQPIAAMPYAMPLADAAYNQHQPQQPQYGGPGGGQGGGYSNHPSTSPRIIQQAPARPLSPANQQARVQQGQEDVDHCGHLACFSMWMLCGVGILWLPFWLCACAGCCCRSPCGNPGCRNCCR